MMVPVKRNFVAVAWPVMIGGAIAVWGIAQNIRWGAEAPSSETGKILKATAVPFAIIAAAIAIIILAGRK